MSRASAHGDLAFAFIDIDAAVTYMDANPGREE